MAKSIYISAILLVVFAIVSLNFAEGEEEYVSLENERGKVIEYLKSDEKRCESWILLPAENLWSPVILAVIYCIALMYCFLGIAIVADIFMGAIEMITSKEVIINRTDPETGETEQTTVKFWNDTVANLTLMALGSSAPEILLAVIETVQTLGQPPGELGPSTIVGSAAFNLLAISAICVVGLPKGEFRRISEYGVFLVTAGASIFAYIWMFIVLSVWTENEVTIEEAIITLLLFPLLVTLAYCQDRNWFRKEVKKEESSMPGKDGVKLIQVKTTTKDGDVVVSSRGGHTRGDAVDVMATRKTIASLMQSLRKRGAADNMTKDEVTAAVAHELLPDEAPQSRMVYRMNAVRSMTGGRRIIPGQVKPGKEDLMLEEAKEGSPRPNGGSTNRSQDLPQFMAQKSLFFDNTVARVAFTNPTYSVLESKELLTIRVQRTGKMEGRVEVKYRTKEGTASEIEDYIPVDGVLVFESECDEATIDIKIVSDNVFEPDETFIVELFDPSDNAVIHTHLGKATVTIIDDSPRPGILGFESKSVSVLESENQCFIKIIRTGGITGTVGCEYFTSDKTAIAGQEYIEASGSVELKESEESVLVPIKIIDDNVPEPDKEFEVHLNNPTGGAILSRHKVCTVQVIDDDGINYVAGHVSKLLKQRMDKFRVSTSSWADQFTAALTMQGSIDEFGNDLTPSLLDYLMHFICIFWKAFFAFIPPTEYGGGWPALCVALVFIGAVTAVVGELATLFGCVIGLYPSIVAITFVALGTSLPDTFASLQAAVQAPDADASIGNVTGSNSVNVFLGLGMPWVLASVYYAAQGEKYILPAGDLGFSVLVFSICAVVGLGLIMLRRRFAAGELGGNPPGRWATFIVLVGLWLLYIILSALRSYGYITGDIM